MNGTAKDSTALPSSISIMPIASTEKDGQWELENSIGYLLNRAAHLIAARFSDDLKSHDINLQAWRILAALSQSQHHSLSELADHTGGELSYVSRSIAAMEKRGLLKRGPSSTDKRTLEVSLTKTGRTFVRELAPKAHAIERSGLEKVSAADLKTTLRTLRAMGQNLVAGADAPTAVNRKLTVARRVKNRALAQEPPATPRRKRV